MATTNDQAVINLGRLKTYDGLLKAEVAKGVSGLQGQIDSVKAIATSAIETHFGTGVPTATNKPASDWTTADAKNLHIGDLYYDDATGYAYRYMKDSGDAFSWQRISDSDVTKAINDAKAAKDAAAAAQTSANNAVKSVTAAKTGGIDISVAGGTGNKTVQVDVKKKNFGGILSDLYGLYVDTGVIATKASVDAKQDKLTAGENVTITGNTISAKDTVYSLPAATKTALGGVKVGANLSVAADGTLSADVQSVDVSGKQDKLTAGYGIKIEGSTISADVDGESDHGISLIQNGNKIGVAVDTASTTNFGTVQLSDAVDSTSTALAATANAVKKAYDLAASKQSALTFATDDDINAMFA